MLSPELRVIFSGNTHPRILRNHWKDLESFQEFLNFRASWRYLALVVGRPFKVNTLFMASNNFLIISVLKPPLNLLDTGRFQFDAPAIS